MSDPTPLRGPRIRRAAIPDDVRVIVRGDDGDPMTNLHQATAFLRRFPDWGQYGLSAYYARDGAEVEDLAADQLERFPVLAVFDLVRLRVGGFEVVPTFRTPHVTIAFTGDLRRRLKQLADLPDRIPNPARIMTRSTYHKRTRNEP